MTSRCSPKYPPEIPLGRRPCANSQLDDTTQMSHDNSNYIHKNHVVWDLMAHRGTFDLDSDVWAYNVLSSFLLNGLYGKTEIKTMFEAHGRRTNNSSYMFLKDSETVDEMKVVAMKALAKELGIVGASGLVKAEVLKVLKPYEDSLRYIPAQGIAKIRRYSKHLRNVRSLASLVGQETVDSLTWLRDNGNELTSHRPIYMIPPSQRLSLVNTFEEILLMKMYNVDKVYESPKTACMEDFCLSSAAMDAMPLGAYREAENPHPFARYPMKLYDLRVVLKYAMEKFGGWEGVLEARRKKAGRRAERGLGNRAWSSPAVLKREMLEFSEFIDPFLLETMFATSGVYLHHQPVKHGLSRKDITLPRHGGGGTKRSRREVIPSPPVEHRGIQSQRALGDPSGRLSNYKDCNGAIIYTCDRCFYTAGGKKMKKHRMQCR